MSIVEDEVGHSGAKQLFSGFLVWSIFHNGIQIKSSEKLMCKTGNRTPPRVIRFISKHFDLNITKKMLLDN